ncbi:hypothetical protein ENSA5_16740 [Enhygromyxa salina]|uniref:Uncharacterized protein n=1 Tax=Enhygromyxa salina TaxID=215803 RepID=A0A2S9YEC3_9BACT|nr:hypothetical protein [Enhygromyxa salina]PRQ03366.1 hypothetical protein ENSA5_16740 [Enhygromyxa salina]
MAQQHESQKILARVGAAAAAIDPRPYEAALGAVPHLVTAMRELVTLATDSLLAVIRATEVMEADPSQTLEEAPSPIADLAFMAHWELRQQAKRLRTTGSRDPWLLIADCDALRQHVINSMVQVERVLCSETGLRPKLSRFCESDLETALETRREYMSFIRGIRSIDARLNDGQLDLAGALRLGAAGMAVLFGQAIFHELRLTDRQQLCSLQGRILDSLGADVFDEVSARRLWLDVFACVQLLAQVHARLALVEHDFNFVAELLAGEREQLGESQLAALDQLEGREPELDRLLADGVRTLSALRPSLVALHDRLAQTLGRPSLQAPGADSATMARAVWG